MTALQSSVRSNASCRWRVARGHYRLADADETENHALVLASIVAPTRVISLLSVLSFHEIGIQLPETDVWHISSICCKFTVDAGASPSNSPLQESRR